MRNNSIKIINVLINSTWDAVNGFKKLVEIFYQVNGQSIKQTSMNPATINNTVFQIDELDGFGGNVNGSITITTDTPETLPININFTYNNTDGSMIVENYLLREEFANGSHLLKI